MLENSAEVSADVGVMPLFEVYFIFEIGSEENNSARTLVEVMAHVSTVYTSIEATDFMIDDGAP